MTTPTVPQPRAADAAPDEPRPAINPALRRLWRGPGSLQIGLDPRRAHVIDGLQASDERLLSLLDGTRTVPAAAGLAGCDPDRAAALVVALRRAGALAPGGGTDDDAVPPALRPDVAAASLRHRGAGTSAANDPDSGAAVILRRSLRRVDVVGCGRVGSTLAALLAAGGVGTVRCIDRTTARAGDIAPGGLPPSAIGARRDQAAGRRVAAVQTQPSQRGVPPRPDLVVLAPAGPVTPPEAAAQTAAVPHFEVVVRETSALLGPLVIPGHTACRRCAELARADRDPAWPLLTAQLAAGGRSVDPCDLTLAATAAGLAAMHALRWLDDGPAGLVSHPLAGAVVEVCGQAGTVRRRGVPAHPHCGCGAAV